MLKAQGLVFVLFGAIGAFQASAQCEVEIGHYGSSICPGVSTTLFAALRVTGDNSLQTLYNYNRFQKGNMFTIVAKEDIVVTGFDVNRDNKNAPMAAYYRRGSFVGHEIDSGGWVAIGRTKSFAGAGINQTTKLPLNTNIWIGKGDTISLYISVAGTSGDMYYTRGSRKGNTYVDNSDMEVLEGIGLEWPFARGDTNNTFSPRVWNGKVHYYKANSASYTWSNSGTAAKTNVNVLGKTEYIVTATKGSCKATDTIELDLAENLKFTLGNDTSFCDNRIIQLDAGSYPNARFSWKPGNTNGRYKLLSTATSVSVVMTSSNGCDYYDTIEVTTRKAPSISLGADTAICSGTSLQFSPAHVSHITYLWNTITEDTTLKTTARTLSANVYENARYVLTVTDTVAKCDAKDNIDVEVYKLPKIDLGVNREACVGDTLVVSNILHKADYTYQWSIIDTSISIGIHQTGQYISIVTDSNTCRNSDTLEALFHDNPNINLGGNREVCRGDQIVLDAGYHGTGTKWQWSTLESTQQILTTKTDTYSVTVTDSFGCKSEERVSLTFRKLPGFDLGFDQSFCDGDSLILDARFDDGYSTYNWSTGASTKQIVAKTTGNYKVTVTDSFGCSKSDNITITVFDNPVLNIGNDTTICKGTHITLDAGLHTKYRWSNGSKTRTISAAGGTHAVVAANAFGCESIDVITIDEIDVPEAAFTNVDLGGQQMQFTNQSEYIESSIWDFGDSTGTSHEENPVHWFKQAGVYTVSLFIENRCGIDSISNEVTVIRSSVQDPGASKLHVYPNPVSATEPLFILNESGALKTLNLYNLNGQSVPVELITGGESGMVQLRFSDEVNAGVYFLYIKADASSYYVKLLIH